MIENVKNHRKGFLFLKTVNRVIRETYQNDSQIIKLCILFTLTSGIYPFCGIFLPKGLLAMLVKDTIQLRDIITYLLAFLAVMSITGYTKTYIWNLVHVKFTKLRIIYIKQRFKKVSNIAYHYLEESSFFDENERAIDSTNGNGKGIDGVYNKLFELPSLAIVNLALIVLVSRLHIGIAILCIGKTAINIFITQKNREFQYGKKEELTHAARRTKHYFKTTYDFRYGKDIRLFKLKDRLLTNYKKEIDKYVDVRGKLNKKEFQLNLITVTSNLVVDLLTYGLLILEAVNHLSIDTFLLYLLAIGELNVHLKLLVDNVSTLTTETQYVSDYYKFIDSNLEENEIKQELNNNIHADIEFEKVSFQYPGTENFILKDFNLKINQGEKIAIVGNNGTGKSTVVKLLTGLFTSYEGKIKINGQDIKLMDRRKLFDQFSVVFQDFNIYAFSVAENVSASNQHDRNRVVNVLKKVGIYDYIETLPENIDHPLLKIIDDGTVLSGGQNQKIAISRALYKDGNIVILDEPTASMDAIAEETIYADFNLLMPRKTVLFISHRLASTRFCNRIILLDENGILEMGSHNELMSRKGEYYKMFHIQGKYYQENI